MAKYFSALLIISTMLLLTSCSLLGSRVNMLNKQDDAKIASIRLEQIIEAINNRDKQVIKNMFSAEAKDEAKNLDAEIDYLLTLFDRNIESWKKIGGVVDASYNYGHVTRKSRYRFNIFTEKEQYLFSILEYTEDTDNPDNVGLYNIKVFNVNNEEPIFSDAGIYMPKEK